MAAVFAFLGTLLMSIVVAVLAALQLGDYFGANDEFIWVIAGVVVLAVVTLVVFAIGCRFVRRVGALNLIAALLALLAVAHVFVPGLVPWISSHSTNPYTVGFENTAIAIELAVSALIAVLVQWGLVRRRLLRTAGEDDLTLWPWIATVLAGLVVLNPFGLAVLGATIKHSAGDYMWDLWAMITAAAVAVLLVMAGIEYYIRKRVMRRRLAASLPQHGDEARAQA
jgi:hypothetical protein